MARTQGKRAIVTGAAQGLGEAIALKLAQEGAQVLLSDIRGDAAAAAAERIRAAVPGAKLHHATQDVCDEGRWIEIAAQARAQMGGLDILVNNAGIGAMGNVEETDLGLWRHVMTVDVDSVFLGCKHVMALMRETSPMGSIVNISSIAGLIAAHNLAAYNSAKAAVWMLTKSVAMHGARSQPQIRCNSVHPAFVDTPILDGLGADPAVTRARLAKQIPLGRLGEPEEVAYLVLYLASDESRFVTGAEFKIDGGLSAM